jgi:hypothetical protein
MLICLSSIIVHFRAIHSPYEYLHVGKFFTAFRCVRGTEFAILSRLRRFHESVADASRAPSATLLRATAQHDSERLRRGAIAIACKQHTRGETCRPCCRVWAASMAARQAGADLSDQPIVIDRDRHQPAAACGAHARAAVDDEQACAYDLWYPSQASSACDDVVCCGVALAGAAQLTVVAARSLPAHSSAALVDAHTQSHRVRSPTVPVSVESVHRR